LLTTWQPDYIHEAQRLARISAALHDEANVLHIEAMISIKLRNYKQGLIVCQRARDLLALCGMSGGSTDHNTMNHQAEIHLVKSEYCEAHNIQTQIFQECSLDWDPYNHAFASLNLAELGLSMTAPKDEVQQDIERARKILLPIGNMVAITMCDTTLAKLYLRDGEISVARTIFKTCLRACNHSKIKTYCLEQLGNTGDWGASGQMFSWTTVPLAHSIKLREKLGINKALQFLGDIFLAQGDEDTAISLFIVALEGFTYMAVHHSRAQCMLRLGDISRGHDELLKAVDFWDAARPLFERSSDQTGWID
jgi:tetratricopeptide (TPR) repeat protein